MTQNSCFARFELEFRVQVIAGIPVPVFEVEEPKNSLLVMFVTSAPNYLPDLWHSIQLVEAGSREYCSYANEAIDVRLYKDHIVIEDYTDEGHPQMGIITFISRNATYASMTGC
jgi:hypothetical protein